MNRISTGTIVGGILQWVNKNLSGGVAGTQFDATYENDMQEELVQGIIVKAGLTPTAGVQNQVITALVTMLAASRVFITSTQSVTVPAWATRAEVLVIGPGGSGAATGVSGNAGGGGGGGGRFEGLVTGLTGGASITVTIGTLGAAVSSGNGNNASATSFGSYINCPGGAQGLAASPYTGGAGAMATTSGSVTGFAQSLGPGDNGGSGPGAGNGGGGNATGSTNAAGNNASAYGAGGGGGVTASGAGGPSIVTIMWLP